MDYLHQKVAFLKGLAEGLDIEDSSKEGKLLLHIISTFDEFADVIEDLIETNRELEEYISYIDEDLTDVEEEVFEFYDDYDEYDDDDCQCMEIECPSCEDELQDSLEDEEY